MRTSAESRGGRLRRVRKEKTCLGMKGPHQEGTRTAQRKISPVLPRRGTAETKDWRTSRTETGCQANGKGKKTTQKQLDGVGSRKPAATSKVVAAQKHRGDGTLAKERLGGEKLREGTRVRATVPSKKRSAPGEYEGQAGRIQGKNQDRDKGLQENREARTAKATNQDRENPARVTRG